MISKINSKKENVKVFLYTEIYWLYWNSNLTFLTMDVYVSWIVIDLLIDIVILIIDMVIAWIGYDKPKLKGNKRIIKVFLYTEFSWKY